MFFEGSEKKFELVVSPKAGDLRTYRSHWEQVVAASNATVLSVIANDHCDAFLLSESSLFVFHNRAIMITCGQTSLIKAVQCVFRFIRLNDVELFIYERKNEHAPEDQATDFERDVTILNSIMPGRSYCFGDKDGHHIRLYHMLSKYHPEQQDTTLEILMHGLDQEVADRFYAGPGLSASDVGRASGLTTLFEGFDTDGFVFDPFGYSLNAIRGQDYYTVHVTPQPECSYASFETNQFLRGDITPLVEQVLDAFRPTQCLIMLFEREDGDCMWRENPMITNRMVHELECGYRVQFACYQIQSRAAQRHP